MSIFYKALEYALMALELPDIRQLLLECPRETLPQTFERIQQIKNELWLSCFRSVNRDTELRMQSEQGQGFSVEIVQGNFRQSLSEFLAPEFSFHSSGHLIGTNDAKGSFLRGLDEACCNFDTRSVNLTNSVITELALVPVVLHEVGHSHQEVGTRNFRTPGQVLRSFVRNVIRQLFSLHRAEIRRSPLPPLRNFAPLKVLSSVHSAEAIHERDAWDRAKKTMDVLSSRGFDVWGAFPGDAFSDMAEVSLFDHDVEHFEQLYVSGGKKAVENAEPVYLPERGKYARTCK